MSGRGVTVSWQFTAKDEQKKWEREGGRVKEGYYLHHMNHCHVTVNAASLVPCPLFITVMIPSEHDHELIVHQCNCIIPKQSSAEPHYQ